MRMLNSSFSQLPGFKTFTLHHGLAGSRVRKILQDRNGFIWIGTWEGVSKYDGHRFTDFTKSNGLSFSLVNDLYEAPDGKILVALNNGSTQAIINDHVQAGEIVKNLTIERFVQMKDKELIVLTDRMGIMRFNNGKLYSVTSPQLLADASIIPFGDSMFLLSSPHKGALQV